MLSDINTIIREVLIQIVFQGEDAVEMVRLLLNNTSSDIQMRILMDLIKLIMKEYALSPRNCK